MSPAMKFRAGCELFEEACRWTLAGIATQFPELNESERVAELRRRMNGTDSLLSLTAALDTAAVPYMIVGSYSSNFYGIPRSTMNADLVIHLPSSGWAKLPALLPDGIRIERQMGFEMITSTRKELLRVRRQLL